MPAIVIKIWSYVPKGIRLCYKKEWKLFYAGYIAAGVLLLSSAGLLLVTVPGGRNWAGAIIQEQSAVTPAVVSSEAALPKREAEAANTVDTTTRAVEQKTTDIQAVSKPAGKNTAVVEEPAQVHWPLTGSIKTEFGWQFQPVYQEWRFHPGIDIEGKDKTEKVKAIYAGTVTDIYTDPATGLTVAITQGKDIIYYGALAAVQLEKGMTVKAGQEIGTPGSSAAEPFLHVHLVIKREGKAINPLDILR